MDENGFSFKFVGIDIVSKAISPQPPDFEGKYFSFDVTAESAVNKQKNWIIQFIRIIIRDENKSFPLGVFTFACFFEIIDFEKTIISNSEGLYVIPDVLELYLKSAAISTTRGIVWSELKGSYLHFAIMPVIDVRTLVPQKEKAILDRAGQLIR